ncbi:MAG: hypothetical protein ACXITV_13205 [Luteibaculaceae bacterium]
MGVKPFRQVGIEDMRAFLNNNSILDSLILEADPKKYNELVDSKQFDTLHYKNTKWYTLNHIQPMQAICFNNKDEKPLFSYFNCVAETRRINQFTWNKFDELETFPPKEYTSYKWTDTLFKFQEIINTFHNLETNKEAEIKKSDKDFTVLIFYTFCTERQSKNLIRETTDYLERFIPDRYDLYFINFDNALYEMSGKKDRKSN